MAAAEAAADAAAAEVKEVMVAAAEAAAAEVLQHKRVNKKKRERRSGGPHASALKRGRGGRTGRGRWRWSYRRHRCLLCLAIAHTTTTDDGVLGGGGDDEAKKAEMEEAAAAATAKAAAAEAEAELVVVELEAEAKAAAAAAEAEAKAAAAAAEAEAKAAAAAEAEAKAAAAEGDEEGMDEDDDDVEAAPPPLIPGFPMMDNLARELVPPPGTGGVGQSIYEIFPFEKTSRFLAVINEISLINLPRNRGEGETRFEENIHAFENIKVRLKMIILLITSYTSTQDTVDNFFNNIQKSEIIITPPAPAASRPKFVEIYFTTSLPSPPAASDESERRASEQSLPLQPLSLKSRLGDFEGNPFALPPFSPHRPYPPPPPPTFNGYKMLKDAITILPPPLHKCRIKVGC